jgi:hypothetical protein
MDAPYAEHLLTRAWAFMGRVGLPVDHDVTLEVPPTIPVDSGL